MAAQIRNNKGQFRAKRSDTRIKTIEKQYHVDLNVRSDMKLGTYLKKSGLPSLNKVLQQTDNKHKK